MSDKSSIEWTDATWNPTRGCTKIAPGCKNCYADTFAERFRGVTGHPYELGFDPRLAPDKLSEPLKWKTPRRIFVDSMSDLFHEEFPFNYIAACFGVMSACQQHTFQVLTKRPERAAEFFHWIERQKPALTAALVKRGGAWPDAEQSAESVLCAYHARHVLEPIKRPPFAGWPLPNVHIGTSIANQKDADKNIPYLLQIPAAVHFLSIEPLIAPVDLDPALCEIHGNEFETDAGCSECQADGYIGEMSTGNWLDPLNGGVQWVIVGGESGPGARPCDVAWIRTIVEQCTTADVPVFVKQLGAKPVVSDPPNSETSADMLWKLALPRRDANGEPFPADRKGGDITEFPEDLRVRQFPVSPDSSQEVTRG